MLKVMKPWVKVVEELELFQDLRRWVCAITDTLSGIGK